VQRRQPLVTRDTDRQTNRQTDRQTDTHPQHHADGGRRVFGVMHSGEQAAHLLDVGGAHVLQQTHRDSVEPDLPPGVGWGVGCKGVLK